MNVLIAFYVLPRAATTVCGEVDVMVSILKRKIKDMICPWSAIWEREGWEESRMVSGL